MPRKHEITECAEQNIQLCQYIADTRLLNAKFIFLYSTAAAAAIMLGIKFRLFTRRQQ